MPKYSLIKINNEATIIADQVETAKADGSYDAKAKNFDTRMANKLQPLSDLALKWTVEHDTRVSLALKAFKAQLAKYAKVDKKKQYDKKSVADLKIVVISVINTNKELRADTIAMSKAMATQYRGNGWVKIAEKAMKDSSAIAKMQKERRGGIDVSTNSANNRKTLIAVEKQLQLFYKKGVAKIGAEGNMPSIMKDIEELVVNMNKAKGLVETKLYSARQGLTILGNAEKDIAKGTDVRKADIVSLKKYVKLFEPAVKSAKDEFKLMVLELATLKKRIKSVVGMDTVAKPNIKLAEAIIKDCNKKIKTQAKEYKTAEKACNKILKGK